jgi:predicted dehydrogenase
MKRLRTVVVGAGRVFERYYLPCLEHGAGLDLVGIVEQNEERIAWLRRRLDVPVEALASTLLDRADCVLVLSSPVSHAALAIEALAAGKSVLVEKPMALTVPAALGVRDVARRARGILRVGFNRRFSRGFRALRDVLSRPGPEVEIRYTIVTPWRAWSPVTDYLGHVDRGGDVLSDVACHAIDLVPWLLRDEARGVAAVTGETNGDTSRVSFALELANAPAARCVVAHGAAYEEWISVRRGKKRWLATPAGIVGGSMPAPFLSALSHLERRADLVLAKVGGRWNASLESFNQMLQSFSRAASRRNESSPHDADAEAGLRVTRLVQACRDALQIREVLREIDEG